MMSPAKPHLQECFMHHNIWCSISLLNAALIFVARLAHANIRNSFSACFWHASWVIIKKSGCPLRGISKVASSANFSVGVVHLTEVETHTVGRTRAFRDKHVCRRDSLSFSFAPWYQSLAAHVPRWCCTDFEKHQRSAKQL